MRVSSLLVATTAVTGAILKQRQENVDVQAQIDAYEPKDDIGRLALEGLAALQENEEKRSVEKRSGCNLSNVSIRRDWADLKPQERKAYSNAVLCLQAKPSKLDPVAFPGAKTRYDDFVVVHVNQSRAIHATGNFLTWHRYFTWTYENALKTECGYKGAQPYWNWGTFAHDPAKSPVFSGADNMSGDGSFVQHNGSIAGTGKIWIPSGKGGGCVTSGPFKNMKVNLGPNSPTQAGIVANPNGLYSYNPRCLRRDISPYAASTWTTTPQIAKLILEKDTKGFQDNINGDFNNGNLGIHSAGHYTIGGDPGADFSASPGDPVFYLHHAMVDRTYWIHQMLRLPQSLTDLDGTNTIFNNPPSPETTLDDVIGMGREAPYIKIRDAMNTVGGTPFCYIYL